MKVTYCDPADCRALTHLDGDPPDEAALADQVRAEVSARGATPRASALERIRVRLDGLCGVDLDQLGSICDALVAEGDLVLGPGGVLFSTPLRVVALEAGAYRLFCSAPTRALAVHLGVDLDGGIRRDLPAPTGDHGQVRARVERAGGVLVSGAGWAGLDRAPSADDRWLAQLDRRLQWSADAAGSLDRDGPLTWRVWNPAADGARWVGRTGAEGRLWRARHPRFQWVCAWTGGRAPSEAGFLQLTSDEADRTRYAVAAHAGHPLAIRQADGEVETTLTLPGWLPQAEHRLLSLHARRVGALSWCLPRAQAEAVMNTLRDRLRLIVTSTENGA